MFICVCKAVSDRRIQGLVTEGASSLREISRETGLGTCCGKCVPAAREVLGAALSRQPAQGLLRLADLPAARAA